MRSLTFYKTYYYLFLLLLIFGLVFCNPPSSRSFKNKEKDPLISQWLEQEPVEIAIPPDEEGKAELTRNFYFILDGSGSMRERTNRDCGGDQKFPNKISGARWAIKTFLQHIPNEVNIGLYIFDGQAQREVVPLGTSNREHFISAVDNIQAGGGTPLANAIRLATNQLVAKYKKQLGYGEYRIVVVTDGKASKIPEAALYAAQHGIPIYSIGLCVGQDHPLRFFSVSYRAADNFADLSKGLTETVAELPNFDITQFEE